MQESNLITQVDHYSVERVKNMLTIAEQFFKAGCFTSDVKNTQQAYVKIQAGAEMGLAPMEAMSDLVLMKGNVTFWGKGLVKRFRKFGWQIQYTDESDNGVTATVTNKDEAYSETATKKEVQAGFGYKADPKAKMRYHALARIARQYIPEILGSISYIAEEVQASKTDFNKEIIDMPEQDFTAEIANLKNLEELTTYYNKNKGKGKEVDKAMLVRRAELVQEEQEKSAVKDSFTAEKPEQPVIEPEKVEPKEDTKKEVKPTQQAEKQPEKEVKQDSLKLVLKGITKRIEDTKSLEDLKKLSESEDSNIKKLDEADQKIVMDLLVAQEVKLAEAVEQNAMDVFYDDKK